MPEISSLCVLIPAHNEEAIIESSIESLLAQTVQPDRIIVVADNCTDGTEEIAKSIGVEVFKTVDNVDKKAGALNQAIDYYNFEDTSAVMVLDADSVLDEDFLENSLVYLRSGGYDAIGGTFYGQEGGGLVGMFQRNEYARYARDVDRKRGRVLVLTGTATVFRFSALKSVIEARKSGVLPGGTGQVYDTSVLTEDNELTLALLHLGFKIRSPHGCRLTTEVMPTWKDLGKQRLRWKRGALENLFDYGFTKITLEYWCRQLLSLVGVIVIFTYLSTILWGLAINHSLTIYPVWLIITGIFMLERAITVNRRGWKQMAVASVILVEMIYDVFLQGVQAIAFLQAALRTERKWG